MITGKTIDCKPTYHNYIREYETLKGEILAERCGIKIEGKNKWKTIIENASVKDIY